MLISKSSAIPILRRSRSSPLPQRRSLGESWAVERLFNPSRRARPGLDGLYRQLRSRALVFLRSGRAFPPQPEAVQAGRNPHPIRRACRMISAGPPPATSPGWWNTLGLALAEEPRAICFPCPPTPMPRAAFLNGLKPGHAPRRHSSRQRQRNQELAAGIVGRAGPAPDRGDARSRAAGRRGEADATAAQAVVEAWKHLPYLRARLLPQPILAALLRESALFLGHDSGITHLAAASRRDLPILALFGPTDPAVWAPPRPACAPCVAIPPCATSPWTKSFKRQLLCYNETRYRTLMPIELDKPEGSSRFFAKVFPG